MKSRTNIVKNRFLPLQEAVINGLEDEPQLSDFEIIKELGSGSFGRVYLVVHKKTKAQYAIKAVDKRNKEKNEQFYFRREMEIMYKITHPNVVKLYSHFEDDVNCYFLMEYISKGNLYGLLSGQKSKTLDAASVAGLIKDIICSVYYLHNMDPPIIHRDIKPENVLIAEGNIAKLTDFGWSNYLQGNEERMTFCGTPIYLAPEMIQGSGHDENVDIWCIGVLLFELLTGRPPFGGNDKSQLLENIMRLKITWPRDININAKNLISKILRIEPKTRISLKDMLQHPFFTKFSPYSESCLVKPSFTQKDPFIVSKHNPALEDQVQSKAEAQEPERNRSKDREREKEREIINENTKEKVNRGVNRQRDISPVPISKLNLERLDKINISKLNVIMMKKSNDGDCSMDASKLKKDYENLTNQYSDLQKKLANQIKLLDDLETKVRYFQKEKDKLLDELNKKEDDYFQQKRIIEELNQKLNDKDYKGNSNNKLGSKKESSRINSSKDQGDLQKLLEHKNKEIDLLKEKISSIESNIFEDDNTSASQSSNKIYKNNNGSEIEKLKIEMAKEKERYEKLLSSKNDEIQMFKDEQKDFKNNEAQKYNKYIHKYEHMVTLADNENKKLKGKIKDLEAKISKMNLSK